MRALVSAVFLSIRLASPLSAAEAPGQLTVSPVVLPGGPGPIAMDYLAYDPATRLLWIPAGNTGMVDVIDTRDGKISSVTGFPTAKRTTPRGERTVGPSSATAGQGVVYIGNRADSQVCAVDERSRKRGGCAALPSSPDGLAYVAPTREVWVTTPRDKSVTLLDVRHPDGPAIAGKIALDGSPEGYAVDPGRALFYTNLEDQDQTLVIGVKSRKVEARFQPGCGEAGPRGLALDDKRRILVVACTDKAVALSAEQGKVLGQVQTGGGVDGIDYDPARHLVYVASGKTATLTVARLEEGGALSKVATAPTVAGARTVVMDGAGDAYVIDSAGGRLLVVHAPR